MPQQRLLLLVRTVGVQIYEPEISRRQKGGKGHGKTVEGSFVGWTNSQGVKTVVCTVDEVLKYSLQVDLKDLWSKSADKKYSVFE